MHCERYMYKTETAIREICDLQLHGYMETRTLIRALEYYTDKRKLDFNERMLAGDMARRIKHCEVQELDEEACDEAIP